MRTMVGRWAGGQGDSLGSKLSSTLGQLLSIPGPNYQWFSSPECTGWGGGRGIGSELGKVEESFYKCVGRLGQEGPP